MFNHSIYLTGCTTIPERVGGTRFLSDLQNRRERKFLGFNEGEPHFYKQAFLEKASNNQLTELETNCVIQPSPLSPRLRISLATRIFGKPRRSARPRVPGRARAASNPGAPCAAAAECNPITRGGLPHSVSADPPDWFRAGSVTCVSWPVGADDQTGWRQRSGSGLTIDSMRARL